MENIVEGNIGTVGHYDLDLRAGKLILTGSAAASPAEVALVVKVDAGAVLDLIAAKVPGQIDDAIIAIIKAALIAA